MSQPSIHDSLDALTEEIARQIIFTLAPGATNDPLSAIKELLEHYLDEARNCWPSANSMRRSVCPTELGRQREEASRP